MKVSEILQKLLFNPEANFDALSFFAAILTVVTTIHIYRDTQRKSIERERYDKFVYPLFSVLEPYLFTDIPDDVYKNALKVMQDNRSILGGKFLNLLYLCEKSKCREYCLELSKAINKEFDRSSSILHLKKRSFLYRLNRRQFKSKLAFVLYLIFSSVLLLLSFAVFLIFIATIKIIFNNLMS